MKNETDNTIVPCHRYEFPRIDILPKDLDNFPAEAIHQTFSFSILPYVRVNLNYSFDKMLKRDRILQIKVFFKKHDSLLVKYWIILY